MFWETYATGKNIWSSINKKYIENKKVGGKETIKETNHVMFQWLSCWEGLPSPKNCKGRKDMAYECIWSCWKEGPSYRVYVCSKETALSSIVRNQYIMFEIKQVVKQAC